MCADIISPVATGGAGTIFEYRLAAIILTMLIEGAHPPIGVQLPVERVGLQQRAAGYALDDIVIYTRPAPNAPRIQFQVKKTLHPIPSDPEFVKVIVALRQSLIDHG